MLENKLYLYAKLDSDEPTKEMAAALSIPPIEKRQLDLQYLTAVFVSSGMNLNNAYFLPSELIKAHNTVAEKPLDKEHNLTSIVGHLHSSVFAYKDGTIFDPIEVAEALGAEVEKLPMDIVMAARIYKAVFPELAEEVMKGEWKVSMECFFKDYDLIVNNIIIPRNDAEKAGYKACAGHKVKLIDGERELGEHVIGRVLRDIIFSGCGLVKNPANPESVILETAAEKEKINQDSHIVLDLTRIDSYMRNKKEVEALTLNTLKSTVNDKILAASYGGLHTHRYGIGLEDTNLSGAHTHMVYPGDLPSNISLYFSDDGTHRHSMNEGVVGIENEHNHDVVLCISSEPKIIPDSWVSSPVEQRVVIVRSGAASEHLHDVSNIGEENDVMFAFGGSHKHSIKLPDGKEIYTITAEDVMKKLNKKEDSAVNIIKQDTDGFEQVVDPEVCVSFKRHVYEKGGDNPGVPAADPLLTVQQVESLPAPGVPGVEATQNDRVVAENWCALYGVTCPVPGGLATHKDCLRWEVEQSVSSFVKASVEDKAASIGSKIDSLVKFLSAAKKGNK